MKTRFLLLSLVCLLGVLVGTTQPTAAAPSAACVLTWTKVANPTPAPGSYILNGVASLTAGNVWAVGRYRPSAATPYNSLIEHWNGSAWSIVPSPNVANQYNELRAVAVLAADDIWAVGMTTENTYSQSLTLHWNGTAWSIVPSPNTASGYGELYSVSGTSGNDVWAVGGWDGATLLLHWQGAGWQAVPAPISGQLQRVLALAANDVWVLAHQSPAQASILHRDAHGWTVYSTIDLNYLPGVNGVFEAVNDFHVSSADDMWVVGYQSQLHGQLTPQRRHWDGSTWSLFTPSEPQAGGIYGIAGKSDTDLWSIGNQPHDRSFLSPWNGTTWTNEAVAPLPASSALKGITAVSPDAFIVAVGTVANNQSTNPALTLYRDASVPGRATIDRAKKDAVLETFQPLFKWRAVNGAAFYKMELRRDARDGKRVEVAKTTLSEWQLSKKLAQGTYYWRVRACTAVRCGEWSDARRFTIQHGTP